MTDLLSPDEKDAITAACDVVGRAGARRFEIGYLHDGVPTEEAGWHAVAHFRGVRVTVEGAGPVEAAEGLARRLLDGALCRRCGRAIRLGGDEPGCLWVRWGPCWIPGCGQPVDLSIPTVR